MKSIFRMNGKETVVEGVVPTSAEFNQAVFDEVQLVMQGNVGFEAQVPFGIPADKCEGYIASTLNGMFEGEVPFKVIVTKDLGEQSTSVTFPAFILFRK